MTDTPEPAVAWHVATPGVLVVTLQRPRANALGLPIIEGLTEALDSASARGDIKVVIVSSSLPGFFAAGADIKHMATVDATSFTAYGDALRGVLDRLAGDTWIAIAAIDGLALGGGLELAMACHLRVAGNGARLGLPEVSLGLIPGAGGTQRLPRLVGRGRALGMMLTARQVPADEALTMGLVDRLVPEGTALEAALQLADTLLEMSLPAQSAVIRCVDAAFDTSLEDGFRFEVAQEQRLFEEGEAKEGITAFLEKRPPKFS
ncbi:enoyl-CoA hydratase [Intrasporangium chromatireducens Q5-1]|uniref:enoyl-CoA hydratase n=1 Tax=Intrasporangium chromatireducens Q5-1 TaxID=584657 RepID=W9GSJ3_9MICO|nr:enoyl-CoA hydratase-related protein [Intrasporangium chromatireducens]EWT07803.1 enoyl-CoA hydratase [Intrasporangium chromatireducens Q5-1]